MTRLPPHARDELGVIYRTYAHAEGMTQWEFLCFAKDTQLVTTAKDAAEAQIAMRRCKKLRYKDFVETLGVLAEKKGGLRAVLLENVFPLAARYVDDIDLDPKTEDILVQFRTGLDDIFDAYSRGKSLAYADFLQVCEDFQLLNHVSVKDLGRAFSAASDDGALDRASFDDALLRVAKAAFPNVGLDEALKTLFLYMWRAVSYKPNLECYFFHDKELFIGASSGSPQKQNNFRRFQRAAQHTFNTIYSEMCALSSSTSEEEDDGSDDGRPPDHHHHHHHRGDYPLLRRTIAPTILFETTSSGETTPRPPQEPRNARDRPPPPPPRH